MMHSISLSRPALRLHGPARPAARREGGFSLVEILTVLAIIGLMLGVIVSNTDKLFGRGQESVTRIFVRDSVRTPLVHYRMDLGDYPSTAEGLNALISPSAANADRWKGPYLDVTGGKVPLDPWGQPYEYRYPGVKNPGGYDIFSRGPDRIADTADDIGN